jgi:imidazolonepropionase
VSRGLLFTPALGTGRGPGPARGPSLAAEVVPEAALAWDEDGILAYAGPSAGLPREWRREAEGPVHRVQGMVIPGFVDCHTHLPFVGWRADEFEARLSGATYRDLQGREGGIYRSSRLLNEASDDEVLDFCVPLALEMLGLGTTALELKSGYGLSVKAELRQLRLARQVAAVIPQTTTVTLLACHAVPKGMDREAWVDAVCHELIPAASAEGLADAVDVYVEDIAFSLGDLERVASASAERGLALRCHADQLGHSSAAEAAVRLGSRSADHLNHIGPEGVAALAGAASTAAVVLPVSTLFLRAQPPPVLELVSAGAAVTLATDFNPGTSPCLSMPEVIAVASSLYRLTPRVALTAATLNPAWVLGLAGRLGSLEPGKRADFLVLDSDSMAMVPYRPGHNPVVETWISGERLATT